MPRIEPLDTARADTRTVATLNTVRARLGKVPNLLATLAQAPVALNGYLQLSETLAGGRLSARQREIIALAVAQANECQYCLSAHTAIGKGAGLTGAEIEQARRGTAADRRDAAIAGFARKAVETRARVSDADIQTLRAEGIDDGLIIEIVAHVVFNLLTNYVNHIAGTEIDFPVVGTRYATAA
jgi:uncharacterized peroxidase-related enzyme